jgi:hypothetical protein
MQRNRLAMNPKLEAVSCLDWDELAFLQWLPSPDLLSLGELVCVVHCADVRVQTWTGGVDYGYPGGVYGFRAIFCFCKNE